MINDGINDVPDKTIAIFRGKDKDGDVIPKHRVLNIVKPSPKKRDWFETNYYKCLPLAIGNQYGFTISLEFDVGFEWNGGQGVNDAGLFLAKDVARGVKKFYPNISTHFGNGILTINTPFFLKTPPGVNLMTINPPNFLVPNVSVLTGVVETDNLRKNFDFNLKILLPNTYIEIPAGYPLAAFIPVPRYYCDKFKLEFAEDIFSQEIIDEELQAEQDATKYRNEVEPTLKDKVGQHYFNGKDVYGNEFKDHQK